jgi:hypothetical protein
MIDPGRKLPSRRAFSLTNPVGHHLKDRGETGGFPYSGCGAYWISRGGKPTKYDAHFRNRVLAHSTGDTWHEYSAIPPP